MKAPRSPHGQHSRVSKIQAVAALLAVLLVSGVALAMGSFKLRTTTVSEVAGGWHVFCEISLPKPPPIAHQTLKFQFTKTAAFERDLVDNNPNPVVNRQALVGQSPSIESLEVDFANVNGTVYARTVFDFSLTRTRGYEAGEYKVQVKNSDGVDIGSPASITLNGDNPVVDRRSMVFDAKNPNMKKVPATSDAGPAKVDETVAAVPMNGDIAPSGSAPPFLTPEAFQKQPEEMAQHPKGCGCSFVGSHASTEAGLLGLASGLGMIVALSRRRRRP